MQMLHIEPKYVLSFTDNLSAPTGISNRVGHSRETCHNDHSIVLEHFICTERITNK
jgi:hypothetical protein